MQRRFTTKRHRPSVWAYFRQVWRASIAFSERLEGMVSILYLVVSSTLAVIASFVVHNIWSDFEVWYLRIGIGIVVFILVQFVLLTPIRMWRDAVWVVNVERGLMGLWDFHEEGVGLLNSHAQYERDTPGWEKDTDATNRWIREWWLKVDDWDTKVDEAITALSPIEARRLKNIVTFENKLKGLNESHTHRLNILREKLERFGKMIESHHPALLPE